MTKQQQREYATYVQICEEFNGQPQLLEAHFVMSEQQERGYKDYREECQMSGVEPTHADFLLMGAEWYARIAELKDKGVSFVIWQDPAPSPKAKAASAGR